MTYRRNTRRGFTLIELLVVVLIIAILAAIALPQYQKVVEKSRVAEAKNMLYDLAHARQLYYLEHNTWPTNLADLEFVAEDQLDSNGKLKTTMFTYYLGNIFICNEGDGGKLLRASSEKGYFLELCPDGQLRCMDSATQTLCNRAGFQTRVSCISGNGCWTD